MHQALIIHNKPYILLPQHTSFVTIDPKMPIREHYHAVYHLVIVFSGKGGTIETDDGRKSMAERSIVIIDPGRKHVFFTHGEKIRTFAFNFYLVPLQALPHGSTFLPNITTDRELLEKIALRLPFARIFDMDVRDIYLQFPAPRWQEIIETVRRFAQDIKSSIHKERPTQSHILWWYCNRSMRFLADLFSFCVPSANGVPLVLALEKRDSIVNGVKSFIRKEFGQKYSLNEISRKLGYSRPYLCRHFKAETGTTIGDYITAMKVQEASEQLRRSDRSISDIALSLDFSSSQHFARIFKKRTGFTPREFRKYRDMTRKHF